VTHLPSLPQDPPLAMSSHCISMTTFQSKTIMVFLAPVSLATTQEQVRATTRRKHSKKKVSFDTLDQDLLLGETSLDVSFHDDEPAAKRLKKGHESQD
jgi:hypothetical protein